MIDTLKIREQLFQLAKDGKVKTKGSYECLPFKELGWQKNHSSMVIQQAVMAHLLDLCDYKDYITHHKDEFDFCLRTKVPRSSSLVLVKVDNEGNEYDTPLQNICRYVPVKEGGKLIKIMPPLAGKTELRRLGIDSEYFVKPCNNMDDFNWDIDYDYYFDKALKLISAIGGDEEDDDDES